MGLRQARENARRIEGQRLALLRREVSIEMFQGRCTRYLARQVGIVELDEGFSAMHQVAGSQALFHLLCLSHSGIVRQQPLRPPLQPLIDQGFA